MVVWSQRWMVSFNVICYTYNDNWKNKENLLEEYWQIQIGCQPVKKSPSHDCNTLDHGFRLSLDP